MEHPSRRISNCLIERGRPHCHRAVTDLGGERPAWVEPRPRTAIKLNLHDEDVTLGNRPCSQIKPCLHASYQSSSAIQRFSSAMVSSLRRYKIVLPTLRELSNPARCRIARFWEAADCERPWISNRPAGTPPSASAALIPKDRSGSFNQVRNSIRPGCAKAFSASWMSSGRFINLKPVSASSGRLRPAIAEPGNHRSDKR